MNEFIKHKIQTRSWYIAAADHLSGAMTSKISSQFVNLGISLKVLNIFEDLVYLI